MEKEYQEEGEAGLTEKQAARLVECIINLGHTKEEAYYALAYVMGAVDKEKEA